MAIRTRVLLASALMATSCNVFSVDKNNRQVTSGNEAEPTYSAASNSSELDKNTALNRKELCEEWADHDDVSQENIATYISDCMNSTDDID